MRARGAADLIALVPVLFGFHPRESLVAVTVHGPRQRLGLQLRIDLPGQSVVTEAADQVVSHLCSQQPDAVLLVAFAERAEEADPVVAAVRARLVAENAIVGVALRADGKRYWSYLCDDPACCPPEGTPYESETNALFTEAVFNGVEVLPDRDSLAGRFAAVSGPARERMVRATARVEARLEEAAGPRPRERDPVLLRAGIDEVTPIVDAFEQDPHRGLGDDEAATLAVWASLVVVRDTLWARFTRENAALQLMVWRQVAARVVPPYEPAVLSLTAFAAWLSGKGAQAQCALDRVTEVDPSYSMAVLVQSAVTGCLSPEVWEGLDVDDVLRSVPGLE